MTALAEPDYYDDFDSEYRSELDAKYEEGFGFSPQADDDEEGGFDDLFDGLFDDDEDDDDFEPVKPKAAPKKAGAKATLASRATVKAEAPRKTVVARKTDAAGAAPAADLPVGHAEPEEPTTPVEAPQAPSAEAFPGLGLEVLAAARVAADRARAEAGAAAAAAKEAVQAAVAKAAAARAAAAEAKAAEEAAQAALELSAAAEQSALRLAAELEVLTSEGVLGAAAVPVSAEPVPVSVDPAPVSVEAEVEAELEAEVVEAELEAAVEPAEPAETAEAAVEPAAEPTGAGAPEFAPHIAPVNEHVEFLRRLRPGFEVPYVDPMHSVEEARIVTLFSNNGEANPRGYVWAGDDAAATRLLGLQYQLGLRPEWIMPWNVHPWFTPGEPNGKLTPEQVQAGLKPLLALLKVAPRVSAIVAHGTEANRLAQMLLKTDNPLIWRRGLKVYKARALHGRAFAGSKERQTEWMIDMGRAYADAMGRAGLQLRG